MILDKPTEKKHSLVISKLFTQNEPYGCKSYAFELYDGEVGKSIIVEGSSLVYLIVNEIVKPTTSIYLNRVDRFVPEDLTIISQELLDKAMYPDTYSLSFKLKNIIKGSRPSLTLWKELSYFVKDISKVSVEHENNLDASVSIVINPHHFRANEKDGKMLELIAKMSSLLGKSTTVNLSKMKLNTEKDKPVVAENRPSWNEYFMSIATAISTRHTCDRLAVGCVLVKDKHIIAQGYNGSISGHSHCDEDDHLMVDGGCKRTIHAEMNAILMCAKLGISTDNAVAYVTHYPCPDCMKVLNQAGIKTVFYREFYGHRYENNFDEGMELVQI